MVNDNDEWRNLIEENSKTLHISPETYLNIVSSSIVQTDKDISELENAIDNRDYSLIQPIAHRLKGVYGNLRLDMLYKTAEAIDILAKQKDDIDKIKEQFVLLKEAFAELRRNVS